MAGAFLIMYRKGHFGIALAVASVIVAIEPTPTGVVVATIAVLVEPLPDWDQNIDQVAHRGFSHTLGFAILLAGVFGGAIAVIADKVLTQIPTLSSTIVGPALSPGRAGSVVAAGTVLGIVSHLAGDMITIGTGEYGVQPLWPLSRWEFPVGLCRADSTRGNYLLFAGGIAAAGLTLYAVVNGL